MRYSVFLLIFVMVQAHGTKGNSLEGGLLFISSLFKLNLLFYSLVKFLFDQINNH